MRRRRKPPTPAPSRQASTPSESFRRRARFYAWACLLGVLGAIFCLRVFATGQRSPHALGWRYLESLPNYWVFYCKRCCTAEAREPHLATAVGRRYWFHLWAIDLSPSPRTA